MTPASTARPADRPVAHAPLSRDGAGSPAPTGTRPPEYGPRRGSLGRDAAPATIARGLLAWARERFPASHLPLFAALYLFAVLHARWTVGTGGSAAVTAADIPGFLAVVGFFLVLRIADEHKDAAVDLVAHPQRVLSSGRTTLARLRVLALIAMGFQLVVVTGLDGGLGRITLTWSAAVLWSALMTAEFFVPGWLRPRMVLYALLHLLVMPLVMIWMSQIGVGGQPLPVSIWPIPLIGLASGAAFEVARKLRAPDDEHPLVDTYTQRLGIPGAVGLLGAIVTTVCAVLSLVLLRHAGAGAAGAAAATALIATWLVQAPAAAALLRFRREHTRQRAKAAETWVGVALMGGFLIQILFQIALRRLS